MSTGTSIVWVGHRSMTTVRYGTNRTRSSSTSMADDEQMSCDTIRVLVRYLLSFVVDIGRNRIRFHHSVLLVVE
eukprot:scaffold75224_cov23-Prasinocladus_malaysianus.AAC.1